MSKIRGIFFDLGGTLFRYPGRRSGGGAVGYVLEQYGIDAIRTRLQANEIARLAPPGHTLGGRMDFFLSICRRQAVDQNGWEAIATGYASGVH